MKERKRVGTAQQFVSEKVNIIPMKYMNPYTIHRNNKQYLTQLNNSSENLFHRNFNDKKLLKHNYDGYLTNESLQIHGLSKESFKPLKADSPIDHLKQY